MRIGNSRRQRSIWRAPHLSERRCRRCRRSWRRLATLPEEPSWILAISLGANIEFPSVIHLFIYAPWQDDNVCSQSLGGEVAGVYPVFAPDWRRNSGRQQSLAKETRTEANKSTGILLAAGRCMQHFVFFCSWNGKDALGAFQHPRRKLRRKFSYCHFIFREKYCRETTGKTFVVW